MKPKSLQQFESNHGISTYSSFDKVSGFFEGTVGETLLIVIFFVVAGWVITLVPGFTESTLIELKNSFNP